MEMILKIIRKREEEKKERASETDHLIRGRQIAGIFQSLGKESQKRVLKDGSREFFVRHILGERERMRE